MNVPGLIIAAPSSGSGKTILTLGLLRHLRECGVEVASAKVGPDYIDPKFHRAATGRPCYNLDMWGMSLGMLSGVTDWALSPPFPAAAQAWETDCPDSQAALNPPPRPEAELLIVEGVMGLFDGAGEGGATGFGSTADLAILTGWPVVLVVDVRSQAQSVGALLHGFRTWRSETPIVGVIFNRVGGAKHEQLLRDAAAGVGLPVLGAIPRLPELALPDRHLGLVLPEEHPELETFLSRAALAIGKHVDAAKIKRLAGGHRPPASLCRKGDGPWTPRLWPLGQRIAVARDAAFSFAYPHLLDSWRSWGAEVLPFSPLADQAPATDADAVFLPGGYPELYAHILASKQTFFQGLRDAAERNAVIYGECGGYMVLGQGVQDGDGVVHPMAGLLPVATSFFNRNLHLGYRRVATVTDSVLGPRGTVWRGHEFHYASVAFETPKHSLFSVEDAHEVNLPPAGCVVGSVMGSFIHLIDVE
ncbi:Hydrogenobyrinate a,c-diamide synthase [Azospirillaceae bacterium]